MEKAEVDIRQIFISIRRRILLVLVVILASTTLGAAHLYLATPLYSSTALVLFDPRDKNLLDPAANSNTSTQASARVDSEVEFIRSDAVLIETVKQTAVGVQLNGTAPPPGIGRRVLATLGFSDNSEQSAELALHETLAKLRRATTVKRLGATYIIAITASSDDAFLAAEIANSLAETYISAQVRHKVANLDSHRTILARHLGIARTSLLDADAERDRLVSGSDSELSDQVDQTNIGPELAARLYDTQHNADLARAQYQNLIQRLHDLSAQTDLQVADSHIISAAIVSQAPSSPNYSLTLTLSMLAGLMAGIALALLYEHLIGGFVTDEQMSSVLKLNDIIALPRAQSHTDADSVADLVMDDPNSPFSEAVRRLRATIAFATRAVPQTEDSGLVIMVCSTAHEEGKTTLALALARCFARSGTKTLLIDGDLRNPGVHQHLKIGPSLALADQLRQPFADTNFFSLTSSDPSTPLSVIIGAERSDVSATDLLGGRAFQHLIMKARSHFDVVIIDTAALGELADALYVAPLAQVALLVTKWATTPQHAVRKILQALRNAGHPSLIVMPVLTQQHERKVRPKLQIRRHRAPI